MGAFGAWFPAVTQLVGTSTTAYGQYSSGQNAADVYDYNQQVAKYRSNYAQDKATIQTAALERDVKGFIGRKRAIAGASGTVTDAGSNVDSVQKIRDEADIDASIIRYNADIESWAAGNEASLLSTQGQQMSSAGLLNAGGTLLSTASRYDWKKKPNTSPFYPSRPVSSSRAGVSPGA